MSIPIAGRCRDVTDGPTFTDLQARDMTYTARALDGTGMACQVTATSARHGYRLVTDFVTDPLHDSVVMHTAYQPLTAQARGYHIYARTTRSSTAMAAAGARTAGRARPPSTRRPPRSSPITPALRAPRRSATTRFRCMARCWPAARSCRSAGSPGSQRRHAVRRHRHGVRERLAGI